MTVHETNADDASAGPDDAGAAGPGPAGEGEQAEHVADRPATEQEAADAARGARDVDLDEVARHEREMAERGADVKGEGAIE